MQGSDYFPGEEMTNKIWESQTSMALLFSYDNKNKNEQ